MHCLLVIKIYIIPHKLPYKYKIVGSNVDSNYHDKRFYLIWESISFYAVHVNYYFVLQLYVFADGNINLKSIPVSLLPKEYGGDVGTIEEIAGITNISQS